MTGKEALNLLFCTSEGLPEDKVYECKKILGKELDELTKYKRAFEILKEKGIFEFKDDNCLYLNAEEDNWWGDIVESSFVRLSDEEYELLEELMKDENKS